MDRNKALPGLLIGCIKSLSARRAWIEILTFPGFGMEIDVALRKESVDRNMPRDNLVNGVGLVALRKESVDRNKYVVQCRKVMGVSLSARRAWIEIVWLLAP